MKPTTKPIQIFRPGRHTAMSGLVADYSEEKLRECAACYDPAVFRAPIVVGHPKLTDPAFGHVDALTFSDALLQVTQGEVDPEFADLVDRKHFTKVSASFFLPDSPSNPMPGKLYLRHVGFLGAAAPAIKGLKAVEFGEGADEGIVTFADWGDMTVAGIFRRLRDWMIGEKGLEVADNIIPDWSVTELEAEARKEEPEPATNLNPAYADTQENTVTPEQAAALEAENARLKAEVAARNEADIAAKRAARHADHASFADVLVSEARLEPKRRDAVVAALNHLAEPVGDAVVEFGDGDDKQPLVDIVKDLLKAQPTQIEFADVATRERAADGSAGIAEFATADNVAVDVERLALHNKVMAHARQHKTTYDEALAVVAHQ